MTYKCFIKIKILKVIGMSKVYKKRCKLNVQTLFVIFIKHETYINNINNNLILLTQNMKDNRNYKWKSILAGRLSKLEQSKWQGGMVDFKRVITFIQVIYVFFCKYVFNYF